MSVTTLQLHKRSSYEYKYIQDKYAVSSDLNTLALADGTTQSFNSEMWAEIITNQFVKLPCFSPDEVITLFKAWAEEFKSLTFQFSINPAKASLERHKQRIGATATFIAIRILTSNKIEVISCGDSNLFLIAADNSVVAYPFADLDTLDSNKHFINTEALLQEKIDDTFFNATSIECQQGSRIILATDALSRLLINKPAAFPELLKIADFEQLNTFCTKHWENKELQEDDISAIVIDIDSTKTNKVIIPPIDFSFPREKEIDFIPASLIENDNEPNFTDMQMNEIRNQFNGIAKDFEQLKKKLRFHDMLQLVSISLLFFIFLYSVFFANNTAPTQPDNETQLRKQLIDRADTIKHQQKEINRLNTEIQRLETEKIRPEPTPMPKTDTITNKFNSSNRVKDDQKAAAKQAGKRQTKP